MLTSELACARLETSGLFVSRSDGLRKPDRSTGMVKHGGNVMKRGLAARYAACAALLMIAGCTPKPHAAAILDPKKVSLVVVGRSSRDDVFATLGRPTRTERNAGGETWIYDAARGKAGNSTLISGAVTASGIVGAFVPYVGLAGSGLGLANTASNASDTAPDVSSMSVMFGGNGLVRDCAYSSTAVPAGIPGTATGATQVIDCQRS